MDYDAKSPRLQDQVKKLKIVCAWHGKKFRNFMKTLRYFTYSVFCCITFHSFQGQQYGSSIGSGRTDSSGIAGSAAGAGAASQGSLGTTGSGSAAAGQGAG